MYHGHPPVGEAAARRPPPVPNQPPQSPYLPGAQSHPPPSTNIQGGHPPSPPNSGPSSFHPSPGVTMQPMQQQPIHGLYGPPPASPAPHPPPGTPNVPAHQTPTYGQVPQTVMKERPPSLLLQNPAGAGPHPHHFQRQDGFTPSKSFSFAPPPVSPNASSFPSVPLENSHPVGSRSSVGGSNSGIPLFTVGDVHNFIHRRRCDQETQSDTQTPPRFQVLRLMWQNKSIVLAILVVIAAMALKLQDQSEQIIRLTATKEALKRSKEGLVASHSEFVETLKAELQQDFDRLLSDHQKIHALELENCRLQHQREQERMKMEVWERRRRLLKHRYLSFL